MISNIIWLNDKEFNLNIASKLNKNESEESLRNGFNKLFKENQLKINAFDKSQLTVFPIMNSNNNATEITQDCWKILNKNPNNIMCSNSRMIVKRKNEIDTKVLSCTLITKDKEFELGKNLVSSEKKVFLNHPFCSQFCVLGNSSCS